MKPARAMGFCLVQFFASMGWAQDLIITTYAGPALPVGGTAADKQAMEPSVVVADGNGGLYVASATHHRVYRVSANGSLSIVAGSNNFGYAGDGGRATDARLAGPFGLAVHGNGDLLIADTHNNRIRKVTSDGIISTVVGTGAAGFGGDGGQAAAARLYWPSGLAFDPAGNLLIADSYNNRIRRVRPDGVISTIAGGGTASGNGGPATAARLNYPVAVALDRVGNLLIAEVYNWIRKVTPDGIITAFAGSGISGFGGDNGPAMAAALNYPTGVALDAAGNVFISDSGNHRIRKVSPEGMISTFAGTGDRGSSGDGGLATAAALYSPQGIVVDAGAVLIADQGGGRLRKVSTAGIISTLAGTGCCFGGDGGPATGAYFSAPSRLALDARGNLFIADTGNRRIRKVGPDGMVSTFAGTGERGSSGDGGPATAARFDSPLGIAVDSAGNLFILDSGNGRIRKVDLNGIITTVATGGFDRPFGLTVDRAGNLYIGDSGSGRVRKVSPQGAISNAVSGLEWPSGVAVDVSGNLFIAESNGARIRKVSPEGVTSIIAGRGGPAATSELGPATGLALDSAGNLFIAVGAQKRILRLSTDGTLTRVAGASRAEIFQYVWGGDGGPASAAHLTAPGDVAVDASGNLFIADTGNNRVREVAISTTPPVKPVAPAVPVNSVVNGASFGVGAISPDSWVDLFGQNLATRFLLDGNLPDSLDGTTVAITDGRGTLHRARLHFVAPDRIQLLVPSGLSAGSGNVRVTNAIGDSGATAVEIASVAPGLFSANASGRGPAAASFLRVQADGSRIEGFTFTLDPPPNRVNVPVDLGPAGDQVYISFFGTGFRFQRTAGVRIGGVLVPVRAAVAQGQFEGLDQLVVGPLPRILAGRRDVDVVFVAEGRPANVVTISIF